MVDEILTERLRLRPWRKEDLTPLAEIFARPEVWRFPFGRGFTVEESEAYLTRVIERQDSASSSPAAAEERGTGRLIGYVALTPPTWFPAIMPTVEIGWRLDPGHWGRGLATEGARAVIDHGFREIGLPEILSIYQPENVASGRVMERIGMHFDRDARHPTFGVALRIYRLSRSQWEASRFTTEGDSEDIEGLKDREGPDGPPRSLAH